jgi:DNA replication protein DnaC
VLQKWCNTKNNKINILLSGYTGTGKTFLIECIANELIKKNKLVLFSSSFNMNNTFLNYHISFDPNRDQIIKPYLESQVLIIDDLGTEPMIKNVTCEYLYLILNERLLNNLPTIITTNLDMNDILTHYGERIFSRLANKKISILIKLDNEDIRLKKD